MQKIQEAEAKKKSPSGRQSVSPRQQVEKVLLVARNLSMEPPRKVILPTRIVKEGDTTIDLHLCKCWMYALEIVDYFVHHRLSLMNCRAVKVITGRGKNSSEGVALIKSGVLELFTRRNYTLEMITEGSYFVYL